MYLWGFDPLLIKYRIFLIFSSLGRIPHKCNAFLWRNNVFLLPRRNILQNVYEITSESQFWIRNVRNLRKSLASGTWFLSPEAGGTAGRDPGEPWRATVSHSLQVIVEEPSRDT